MHCHYLCCCYCMVIKATHTFTYFLLLFLRCAEISLLLHGNNLKATHTFTYFLLLFLRCAEISLLLHGNNLKATHTFTYSLLLFLRCAEISLLRSASSRIRFLPVQAQQTAARSSRRPVAHGRHIWRYFYLIILPLLIILLSLKSNFIIL